MPSPEAGERDNLAVGEGSTTERRRVSAKSYVDQMLERMLTPGDDREEASLELSLLIGREIRRNRSYDAMVEGVLGPERAARRLSANELADATERLLDIVRTQDPPDGLFLFTLGATLDRGMIGLLVSVIDRYGEDLDHQDAVQAALAALAPFRGTFDDEAIRRLAKRCPDEDNRDSARGFLDPASGYRRHEPEGR